jgi:hypothetical protein
LAGWPALVDACWPTFDGFNLMALEVAAAPPLAGWVAALDACWPELDDGSAFALEFGAAG